MTDDRGMRRAGVSAALAGLALVLTLFSASAASAQQPITEPPPEADYSTSVALHVTAAIAAPVGTIAVVFGTIAGVAVAYGSGDGAVPATIGLIGGGLLIASIAIGIAASVVHSHVRRDSQPYTSLRLRPDFWASPLGAGGGLTLSF